MRYPITLRIGSALVLALGLGLAGCTRAPSGVPPPEPTTIPVSYPAQREITDFVEFTGRTEAVQSVDIRPRTTGYLVKIPFKEGSEVKAGDLLFVIDQRPYQAQLDQALGQVDLYQAQLKLANVSLGSRIFGVRPIRIFGVTYLWGPYLWGRGPYLWGPYLWGQTDFVSLRIFGVRPI